MGNADNAGSLPSPGKLLVGKTFKPGELAATMGKDIFGKPHGKEFTEEKNIFRKGRCVLKK